MVTVLITGGAGFLGKRVSSKLKKEGFTVTTTDRAGKADLIGDLSDPRFVEKLPDTDVLIHLASVQYVSLDLPLFNRNHYFFQNNIKAANNLLARYGDDVKFAILTSTSMVYSSVSQSPIDEKSPTHENGIYSKSKLEVERVFSRFNSPVAVIRPCIIAGPGRGGLFISLQNALIKYKVRVIPGAGNYNTSVVHVDDVSSLVSLLATKQKSGVYNCAGLDPMSISQWGEILAEQLQVHKYRDIKIPMMLISILSKFTAYRLLAREQVEMLKRDHYLDISKSLELGWAPTYGTNQILEMTAKAFLEDSK